MIPGAFSYHRPGGIGAAVALLAEKGEDARVIAGGHSLIPMMKLRMAQPSDLIDLGGIAELRGIALGADEAVIGAMVTQAEVIGHAGLAARLPLLRETALQIADPQVRNRGTLGGNVANGDPGNDMPAIMLCLGAAFDLAGPSGTRRVSARGFYLGPFETARQDSEILTAIRIPLPPAGTGMAYLKQKRKIGDYATAAAAVALTMAGGRCLAASVAMTNLAPMPVWAEAAGAALTGSDLGPDAVKAAVAAMQDVIDPAEDNKGPVAFKRHVAGVMLARAVAAAASRA